ncbi:tetratricopeptide repeat protein [Cohnella silvisoli]|uniref:Tetratricopeptide repeat protein n=1 Tax=Cohnella silvisoli TaxID=2873699 RepID=A0ABV1KYD4_9BACL|nr:tetratricopeptide repeat protein [Cohnella silvisoli]MCD9021785.1 tetratricopeptide repeat protein [Cohnella silvisoli]
MVKSFARWMAKRLHKQQKLQQSLRWYDRWGSDKMTADERVDYAGLLHDVGKSEQAVDVLTAMLQKVAHSHAYERRAHIYNELGKDEEAIADLNEAIRLDPGPYIYWYTRAISHHDRGEFDLAVQDFKEALKRREDSKASTYYELGNVYMKIGNFTEAEACYRQACANPDKAISHYYYRQAQALEQLNRLEDAQSVLLEGIKLQDRWAKLADRGAAMLKERTNYSHAAVASFIKGAQEEFGFRLYESRLFETRGELADSLASIDKALQFYPNAAELQLRKGNLLRQLERNKEAVEVLIRLKDNNPVWLPAYMELSTTYRMKRLYAEAVEVLQEAKKHFPSHTVVRFWLADAYREAGKAEEARKENEELTDMEPEDPLNWKQRAELAIDEEQYEEADKAYTQALQLDETADFFMRRSYSRYMADRYEEAMMDIQSAVKLDESLMKESKTAYALGELYVGMGNWELAEAEYSRALALEPDNSQIYDRRARCRFADDRLGDALEDCNRGLQLDPSNARLTWLRGLIQYRLDDHEAALIDSLTYSDLLPGDSQGHYNLGLIYNHLDRHDEAIAAFTKVIELNPFEAQAYLERASLWYHHSFDRVRATDDLAQWLLYAGGETLEGDRFELLNEVRGFDDEMRERAKEQFLLIYGNSRYLS